MTLVISEQLNKSKKHLKNRVRYIDVVKYNLK